MALALTTFPGDGGSRNSITAENVWFKCTTPGKSVTAWCVYACVYICHCLHLYKRR